MELGLETFFRLPTLTVWLPENGLRPGVQARERKSHREMAGKRFLPLPAFPVKS